MSNLLPAGDSLKLVEIAEQFGIDLIVLFGSWAKGFPCTGSDCDIAVKAEKKLPDDDSDRAQWEMSLAQELAEAIEAPEGIDLITLNRASPLLMYEVARSGRPMYQKAPLAFRRFQSLAYLRYFDSERTFHRRSAYLKERIYGRRSNEETC